MDQIRKRANADTAGCRGSAVTIEREQQCQTTQKQKQIDVEKPDDAEDKTVESETKGAPQRKIKRRLN